VADFTLILDLQEFFVENVPPTRGRIPGHDFPPTRVRFRKERMIFWNGSLPLILSREFNRVLNQVAYKVEDRAEHLLRFPQSASLFLRFPQRVSQFPLLMRERLVLLLTNKGLVVLPTKKCLKA
jgi:hypothetical protein